MEQRIKDAIALAVEARLHAYTPYSHYKVGAAIISDETNTIYSGCNVENGSYGATICAERGAVMKMISEEGGHTINTLVVVSHDTPPAPPCALCLQVLAEFCTPDTQVYLLDIDYVEKGLGDIVTYTFSDLLPHPFVLKKK